MIAWYLQARPNAIARACHEKYMIPKTPCARTLWHKNQAPFRSKFDLSKANITAMNGSTVLSAMRAPTRSSLECFISSRYTKNSGAPISQGARVESYREIVSQVLWG